jgi:hypothetical protein
MKLQLVPARQGWLWMRQGIQVFWRQPIALSGLFFMFLGLMTLVSMVPVVGSLGALVLLPACTAGLMIGTREAAQGRFPKPRVLIAGLRASPTQRRQMLILGACYALGVIVLMLVSTLADGGDFARIYLLGGRIDADVVEQPAFQSALWISMLLYVPLSALFWHAPALVHWHNVPAAKSLFFSLMACLGNWKAMLIYMAAWAGLYTAIGLALVIFGTLLGSAGAVGLGLLPAMLMLTAMFFNSAYFTFKDSFQNEVLA